MSCGACNCEECNEDREHDLARNRSNDCQDERLEEDGAAAIGRVTSIARQHFHWADVEPANEVQAKAWMGYINEVYAEYPGVKTINMMAMLSMVAQKIPGLKAENYPKVIAQVQRLIYESHELEIRKGKNGGVFRKEPDTRGMKPIDALDFVDRKQRAEEIQKVIAAKEAAALADNYTCKGCGNTKLNNITDKSCWSCGRQVGT